MPRKYSEEVNDAIADVNSSDKDKLKAIKDFLKTKKKSAILGIDPELDQHTGYRGNGRRSNSSHYSSTEDNQHVCEKRCRKTWDLLGCVELYKLQSAKQRRQMISKYRGCFKCGSPFKKMDRRPHRCYWGMNKADAQCTAKGCLYAAALCSVHEDEPNCSDNLMDWLKKKKVKTDVFVASSVNRDEDKPKSSDCHVCTLTSDLTNLTLLT